MLSALIPSELSYPAMPQARQPVHQRFVQPGPLVLGLNPLKFPNVHTGYKPNCLTREVFEVQPMVFLQRSSAKADLFFEKASSQLPFPQKALDTFCVKNYIPPLLVARTIPSSF